MCHAERHEAKADAEDEVLRQIDAATGDVLDLVAAAATERIDYKLSPPLKCFLNGAEMTFRSI